MKKLMIAVLTMALSGALWADSTYAFTYQAALRDEHGNVIMKDGEVVRNHKVTIRLWDAPANGALLWARTFNVMTDTNGVFNLAVSDEGGTVSEQDEASKATLASVLAKNQAGDVYIGLEVEKSAGEIVPRQRLFAAPFAAVANDVRKISKDIIAGGKITLVGDKGQVVVSADGIDQQTGDSTFHTLAVNDTLSVAGHITTNDGLTVNGLKGLEVSEGLIAAKKGITGHDGTLEVKSDLKIDGDKKLTIGNTEVVPVPVGGIIMWTKKYLPDNEHWAVCDGRNGTPDLRNRFIVGAGSSYSLGDVGGEAKVTLTVNELPSHTHGFNRGRATDLSSSGSGTDIWARNSSWNSPDRTDKTGGDQPHENRPPYYALYYIMRIK